MGTKFKNFHLIMATLLLFLCFFSFVLLTHAVPSSRSPISPNNKHHPSTQFLLSQGKVDLRVDGKEEARRIKGRMDVELTDYAGTGANPNHDPRNPGNSG